MKENYFVSKKNNYLSRESTWKQRETCEIWYWEWLLTLKFSNKWPDFFLSFGKDKSDEHASQYMKVSPLFSCIGSTVEIPIEIMEKC